MRIHLLTKHGRSMPYPMLIILAVLGLTSSNIRAQRCPNHFPVNNHLKKVDQQFKVWRQTKKTPQKPSGGLVADIPVVVHVLYKTNAQNISDAQIQSQIDVLNEDYNQGNNWQATIANFRNLSTSAQINFHLATKDPNGNPTTGITRTATNKNGFDYTANEAKKTNLGGVDPWPVDRYLNIWVVNEILFQGIGGTLGYAQFPGLDPATDGVVIVYNCFGRIGTLKPPFDGGRTATHEIGHWLGLYHLWGKEAGDGCNANDDDLINDTPMQSEASAGCNTSKTSCGSQDMVQNFMDYSDDDCMTLFTKEQVDRVHFILNNERTGFLVQNLENDIAITGVNGMDGLQCGSSFNPILALANRGSKTQTTVSIEVKINGNSAYSQNHTVNMLTGDNKNINLGTIPTGPGTHNVVFTVSIPNTTDENPANNNYQVSKEIQPGNRFIFTISNESKGANMDWDISSNGSTVTDFGSVQSTLVNNLLTQEFCLPKNLCYDFTISDAFVLDLCSSYPQWNSSTQYKVGDQFVYQGTLYEAKVAIWGSDPITFAHFYTNLGPCPSPNPADYFNLTDASNSQEIINTTLGNYQSPQAQNFCVDLSTFTSSLNQDFKVFPNPASNLVQWNSIVSLAQLYNLQGSLVLQQQNTSSLNVDQIAKGVYFLTLHKNTSTYTFKLKIK